MAPCQVGLLQPARTRGAPHPYPLLSRRAQCSALFPATTPPPTSRHSTFSRPTITVHGRLHHRHDAALKGADSRGTVRCAAGAIEELRSVKRSKAFGTAAQYDSALQEAAESAEWMLCVELLAEARLLQHALGSSTVEGAILCVSEAGQAVKAAQELIILAETGDSKPSGETLAKVMQALSRGKEAEVAGEVMQACGGIMCPESSQSYNCLLRAYARADKAEAAVALFDKLFKADLLEGSAFTTMASMHLRLGDPAAADEMLDLRE